MTGAECEHEVAPLPALSELGPGSMGGPFPWCNWVIGRQVLMGAFPETPHDGKTVRILNELLLNLEIRTFVCHQAEYRKDPPESNWRKGRGLRPYHKDAVAILAAAAKEERLGSLPTKLDFLHLPIWDGSVATDAALQKLEAEDCSRIWRGEWIYIHCWGGHGRTGTLVALLLSSIYGLDADQALAYTQALHDCRSLPQGAKLSAKSLR